MRTLARKDSLQVTCNECGYAGSIADVELHSCEIQEQGGRCEDYPCCGHTDGDGCQQLASHTSDFYYRNPQFLHEPGSPEWYDAMEEMEGEDHEQKDCDGGDLDYVDDTHAKCIFCERIWDYDWNA